MVSLCQQVKQSISNRLLQLEIVPLCLKQMPNVTPKGNGYTQNLVFVRKAALVARVYSPSKVAEVKMGLCAGTKKLSCYFLNALFSGDLYVSGMFVVK